MNEIKSNVVKPNCLPALKKPDSKDVNARRTFACLRDIDLCVRQFSKSATIARSVLRAGIGPSTNI